MAFVIRCAVCLLSVFLLYPVLIVIWNGPDRDFGYGGGIMLMMFLQFISPFHLWKVPLTAAALIAFVWQYIVSRKSASSPK